MSRKLVAVVLGATLMLGIVGVGAAPAGAQEPIAQLDSLNLLVAQIDQVCSDASYLGGTGADRLATVCAQLPSLKAVVDQINEVCANPVKPQYACSAGLIYGNRGNF
jgi:hypothetical protein